MIAQLWLVAAEVSDAFERCPGGGVPIEVLAYRDEVIGQAVCEVVREETAAPRLAP